MQQPVLALLLFLGAKKKATIARSILHPASRIGALHPSKQISMSRCSSEEKKGLECSVESYTPLVDGTRRMDGIGYPAKTNLVWVGPTPHQYGLDEATYERN
jgi:hypothetical protein